MRNTALMLALLAAAASAPAQLISESWGPSSKRGAASPTPQIRFTHPGTLKVVSAGKVPRLIFDVSAVPKGARVHGASLHLSGGQPREPVRIFLTGGLGADAQPVAAGKPLKLGGPGLRSFDATEAVRLWVKDPAKNLGFAVVSFGGRLAGSWLAIRYEAPAGAKPAKVPPQVEGLGAVHRDGQTFLVWKELPTYRPPAKEILWITRVSGRGTTTEAGPGKDVHGYPRPAAIKLQTLRNMQGLAVRDKAIGQWARAMPPFKRLRQVPTVYYRVYRHGEKITPASLKDAELIGQVDALCAYQGGFVHIDSHGEYYAPRERADSVIPTWSVGPGEPVCPGEAYYVHTPKAGGKSYYAVTAVRDGTENAAQVADANSLAAPLAETAADPKPVLQFVTVNRTRYGNSTATEFWHAYWLGPPLANIPANLPRRVVMAIPKDWPQPGAMKLNTHAYMGPGWKVDDIKTAYLHVEQDVAYAGDLCYHSGRGTLLSFREGKVDYFSDRYVTSAVRWALGKWKVDRSRITSSIGSHYGVRHPELFPILWFGPYEVDYDQKWNPCYGSLFSRLGPTDLSRTVDGHRAWDVFSIAWYLAQDPGKDIPFWVHDVGGKESGHAVEYGWQDDAKGLAALRDFRQPHVAHWGGGVISREIVVGLRSMSWTRSVPAFSNCSLDSRPGNGDPADGDPWGQINGFLFWEFKTIQDEKDNWAMTVYLTGDCPDQACTVDVTPRHLKKFKPKAGEKFTWTNTSVAEKRKVRSGNVTADKWGLVTLPKVQVTKGRNRIEIARAP